MRETEFRGQDKNGKWHYGDLEYNRAKEIARIHSYDEEGCYTGQHRVIPDTVGEFAGLHSKQGGRIYEGDIVRHIKGLKKNEQGQFVDDFEIEVVKFEYAGFSIGHLALLKDLEVIGNIHDNPELLEHGSQN